MHPRDEERIRIDLQKFNKVRADLGDQMARYVCVGDNDSVLLTVTQLKNDIRTAMRTHLSSMGQWTSGRSDVFLMPYVWNPAAIRRYGEVLAPLYDESWMHLAGSDRSPSWFRTVLRVYGEARATALNPHMQWKQRPPDLAKEPWPIARLKSLLGDDETPILDTAFERDTGWRAQFVDNDTPERMTGFVEHLQADPERRVRELASLSAKARAYGLRALAHLKVSDAAYFDFAFAQAGETAKTVREAATVMLRGAPSSLIAVKARSDWPAMRSAQRLELVRVFAAVCGDEAPALLNELLENEKNENVRAEVNRLLRQGTVVAASTDRADGPDGYSGLSGQWIGAPAPSAPPEDKPVSSALRALIDKGFAAWRAEDEAYNRDAANKPYFHRRIPVTLSATALFCALAERGGEKITIRHNEDNRPYAFLQMGHGGKDLAKAIAAILAHPDLTAWHLARVCRATWHGRSGAESFLFATPPARALRDRIVRDGGLRQFANMSVTLGDSDDACMVTLLSRTWYTPDLEDWPAEQVWPYFLRYLDLIDEALGLRAPPGLPRFSETRCFDVLELFPETPARYLPALLDRAVGDRKVVRQPARDLLAGAASLDALLLPLLKHSKSEMRAGAAQWLAERRDAVALDEILKAARKEKHPSAKAAMVAAAARLGGDIAEFVSKDAMLSEAEAGLRKTPAKGLDWFPFDSMPPARLKSGEMLEPAIVRWWIVLAAKLKDPGTNPWFELLFDQLEPASAAALGLAIFQAWIAYDTTTPTDGDANAHAAQQVDAVVKQRQQWVQQWAKYGAPPGLAVTREAVFAELRHAKLSTYLNSGNDEKGVLSLASRVPGVDAVNIARAFLRDHYTRTAQCKAVLQCLAANASPAAIQFVLTIARRWRTRTVQQLAGELVDAIAERRGWTADQLADRIVPAGGFDEDGVLELSVGDKVYRGRLDASGKITLYNAEGKAVQNLPSSAPEEAAAALKAAKGALAAARKEIKQAFELQSRRLYEALCTERDWPVDEWREFLLGHPVMNRLAQRLIWLGIDDAGNRIAFRLLEDLTLTDSSDSAVSLDTFACIRLAHDTLLTEEQRAAWRKHLADYEVMPLFDQLGRGQVAASAGQDDALIIDDRKGWLIEAFKLRTIATKLGYTRGGAEDGGWFTTYDKRFDGLQIAVVIDFSGNSLPEENRVTALMGLRFAKMRKGAVRWDDNLPLNRVPPVLLSEAWNDFHAIAAAGTGYDAGWEKRIT